MTCRLAAATATLLGFSAAAAAQPAAPLTFPRNVATEGITNVIAGGAQWELVWQGTDNADGISRGSKPAASAMGWLSTHPGAST
jgi:hypothetical protein